MILLTIALATGISFIAAIVARVGNGFVLHEVAGLVLAVLLVAALGVSIRSRSHDSRPMWRVAGALVALAAAAATGASLATGALSGVLGGLPLLPLVVMLAFVTDGIRVTLLPPRRALDPG